MRKKRKTNRRTCTWENYTQKKYDILRMFLIFFSTKSEGTHIFSLPKKKKNQFLKINNCVHKEKD